MKYTEETAKRDAVRLSALVNAGVAAVWMVLESGDWVLLEKVEPALEWLETGKAHRVRVVMEGPAPSFKLGDMVWWSMDIPAVMIEATSLDAKAHEENATLLAALASGPERQLYGIQGIRQRRAGLAHDGKSSGGQLSKRRRSDRGKAETEFRTK